MIYSGCNLSLKPGDSMEPWRKKSSILGILGYSPFVFFMIFSLTDHFILGVGSALFSGIIFSIIISKYGRLKTIDIVAPSFFGICALIILISPSYVNTLEMYTGAMLYGVLAVMALVSLLVENPFTLQHAKEQVIEAVWNTPEFFYVNYVLTWIFAFVFVIDTGINLIWNEGFFPVMLSLAFLFLAIILTKILPKHLVIYYSRKKQKIVKEKITLEEIFEGMPKAFNPGKAANWDITIQYNISGKKWAMEIKNQECKLKKGEAKNSNLTIFSDEDTWISISTGRISGQEAFMNGKLKTEGDMNILFKMDEVFEKKK